jgi:aminopeptidase N
MSYAPFRGTVVVRGGEGQMGGQEGEGQRAGEGRGHRGEGAAEMEGEGRVGKAEVGTVGKEGLEA